MEQPVDLRYVWTADEMFSVTRWHYRQMVRPAVRWCIHLLAALLMLVGLLGMVVLLDPTTPFELHPAGEISAAVIIAVGLAWFVLPRPYLRWIVSRQFKSFPNQHRDVEYQITRERIFYKTRISEGSMSWEAFTKVVQTPVGLLMYMTDQLFLWFPRGHFANDGEFERVVQIARSQVPRFHEAH